MYSVFAAEALEADEISNDQMVTLYQEGAIGKKAWVVDSRPVGKYIAGHIPGALNLPLDVLKKDATSIDKLSIPKTAKTVFYCAGRECTLSVDSAEIFKKVGYSDVWVYRNGVPGWNQKAQPSLASEVFIKKGNVVLIDTVPGPVTVSTAGNQVLQLGMSDLTGDKGHAALKELSRNAPIVVLERGDMSVVNDVMEDLREQDFRRMAYFPVSAWTGTLAAAPAMSKLTWSPVYAPGQVPPKAFEEAVASGKFILDVRPAVDYVRGHFKGAVNIPIEELEKNFGQVPTNVPVFVNCASGAKSQKTYDILSRKGYTNVAFLDAEVSCKGEQCSIKE